MISEMQLFRACFLLSIGVVVLMPSPSLAAGVPFTMDLAYGMKGSSVGQLQDYLRTEGYFSDNPTGNFLSETFAAVKEWQAAKCVPTTGYFGPISRQAVATGSLCSTQTSTTSSTSSSGQSATVTIYGKSYIPSSAQGAIVVVNGKSYVRTTKGFIPVSGGGPGQQSSQQTTVSTPTYLLSVTTNGSGTGTVTSTPAGISCGGTCSASFSSGTVVTLQAAVDSNNSFGGWSGGGCSGTGSCTVTVSALTTVTATFNAVLHLPGPS